MLKLLKVKIVLLFLLILSLTYLYKLLLSSKKTVYLSPPSIEHWFGTDMIGHDIFLKSMNAFAVEIATILIVLPVIFFSGLTIGIIISYYSQDKIREFLLNIIHYWVTLPVLLIALFMLILIGSGQINAIMVIIFVMIPTQSFYVYNQLETTKKLDFVIAKISYGFTKYYIYINHLYPNIKDAFINYTLFRIPEILMMNLALNFLGLGVQPPSSSFGRMLFDGLSFMFSAWWMWVFVIVLICFLFVGVNFIVGIKYQ